MFTECSLQNKHFWQAGLAQKPKTVVVVAQVDHGKRCKKLVLDLLLRGEDGSKVQLGIPK
jgi:hypothetical protein